MLDDEQSREAVLAHMQKTGTTADEIAVIVHPEISPEEVARYLANEPLGERAAMIHRIMRQFGQAMDDIDQNLSNNLA